MNFSDLLQDLNRIAKQAGDAILEVYNRPGDLNVDKKSDDSPITEADLAAHHILEAELKKLTPDIPFLSEESEMPSFEQRSQWTRYWLVDPLDGTKEFVNRNGEFTVNIALIESNKPVAGVVYVPVTDVCYYGATKFGAFKSEGDSEPQQISTRSMAEKTGSTIVVASRRHGAEKLDAALELIEAEFGTSELTNMGSSLKLCLVAEGKADIYPRLAPTCEWDTAAAQAVLEAAGGIVVDPKMAVFEYNRKEELLNPFFYAIGDTEADWEKIINKID